MGVRAFLGDDSKQARRQKSCWVCNTPGARFAIGRFLVYGASLDKALAYLQATYECPYGYVEFIRAHVRICLGRGNWRSARR